MTVELVDDRPVKERVAAILDGASLQLAALHKEVQDETILACLLAVCISPLEGDDEPGNWEWVYSGNLRTPEAYCDLLAELAETITNPGDAETVQHRMV